MDELLKQLEQLQFIAQHQPDVLRRRRGEVQEQIDGCRVLVKKMREWLGGVDAALDGVETELKQAVN